MSSSNDLLINFRRSIHAIPEISCHETQTQKKVRAFLEEHTDAKLYEFAHTALLAVFDSGRPGPNVMFRSELDALPIQEINEFDYQSQVEGVSHMCGHDGHTAINCGLALKIQNDLPEKGRVLLIFQPAEENGKGAEAVVNDAAFKDFEPDYIFALHNLPGYPMHKVILKKNEFTAAVKTLILKFHGTTAHAAEPENGINPALPIAAIIKRAQKLTNNDPDADDFQLITPVYAILGDKAYGISAGYGELHLTIRSWKQKKLNRLGDDLLQFCQHKADENKIKIEHEWVETFAATQNDDKAVDYVKKAVNNLKLENKKKRLPFKWGEDFGLFTQNFKGAMFGLGAGVDTPALHNPDYDFPDELIETGVNIFNQIRKEVLSDV